MNTCLEGTADIFAELLPGSIEYRGAVDLAQYYVRDRRISKDGSTVAVTFSLGRRLLSTFLTTYVPTLLLNMIALSTNYFKVIIFMYNLVYSHILYGHRISSLKQL